MKIALVHNFGHNNLVQNFGPSFGAATGSGGDADEAVLGQALALGGAGHEVRLVAAGLGRDPLSVLRAFAPDVVHVHQLSPGFGRARLPEWTGPLVATLPEPGPPRARRLPFTRGGRGGARTDPLLRRADRVIVPSELGRETYERAGLPPERITVLPHCVPAAESSPGGDVWVCAGRLAAEENVLDLVRRWPAGRRLDVLGTGPLEQACRAAAPASVRFLGEATRPVLRRALPGYRGLVLPGRWRTGTVPLFYPEALAAGLPVLAFEGSAAPRAVRADGTGTVTGWDAPLPAALDAADRIFPTLREHCRGVHAKKYGEAAWAERVERLYAGLIATAPPAP
ncbi:glycosyltransferase [Streptomyces sp. NPDC016845]|uniref:glycosyltransferase n=1 Tax=Streptomyces sp. NPDC016845 TaxID=3364972 RepID=UPI0037A8D0CC